MSPYYRLVQGRDGYFYGTTLYGIILGTGPGTIFRISGSGGDLTNLWSFTGGVDGAAAKGVTLGSDGRFYGTTYEGGTNGVGSVFRIDGSGSLTNLYSFTGIPDGAHPQAPLVQGSDGNLYGTTWSGGTNGSGSVFRISPSGSYSNLHSFSGPDGANPFAALVQGNDGNFYGTTWSGGTNGDGTIFRISSSGSYSNLHIFSGPEGANPLAALVQGNDGNFYGTTEYGGTNSDGTVFRISPSGALTNLWSFTGGIDGAEPMSELVQGSDGNFYGTTYLGGVNDHGTVYRISPSGTLTNLHLFTGGSDGAEPFAGLVQGSDGNLYGATGYGGNTNLDGGNGYGTVFRLTVPLNPPANQISAVSRAGNNLIFNIPSVASETYQLQFSSSMTPTNWVNVPGVSVTNSIGALLTVTNFGGASQPQGFYRFDITP